MASLIHAAATLYLNYTAGKISSLTNWQTQKIAIYPTLFVGKSLNVFYIDGGIR